MCKRVFLNNPLNGRTTIIHSSKVACAQELAQDNTWTSTENNETNADNINFSNGNVNNNNNKYNSNVVRAVAHYGELFEHLYLSMQDAYLDCLKGKRNSAQALLYIPTADEDLIQLTIEVWERSYRPGTSIAFVVKVPKFREVFAASFRDRIIHHWIFNELNPIIEERLKAMGDLTFNCRKGYGVSRAAIAVHEGMRIVSRGFKNDPLLFKGDFVGFFMNINKNILWYLLRRFIRRHYRRRDYLEILLFLVHEVIFHRPERDCVLNSPKEYWHNIEPSKSLFRINSEKGMPIGNLTTQLFANFYISYFDMYVRYVFRRHLYSYSRFVDDFVLICEDSSFMLRSIPRLEKFLQNIGIQLHKRKRYIQPVSHGTYFIGSYIKPGRTYLNRHTVGRMEQKMHGIERQLANRDPTPVDIAHFASVINSYLGFCKGRHTFKRKKLALDSMTHLKTFFIVAEDYSKVTVKPEYKLIKIDNL